MQPEQPTGLVFSVNTLPAVTSEFADCFARTIEALRTEARHTTSPERLQVLLSHITDAFAELTSASRQCLGDDAAAFLQRQPTLHALRLELTSLVTAARTEANRRACGLTQSPTPALEPLPHGAELNRNRVEPR